MNVQYILSVCFFAAFILAVIIRAAILRRNGIRAIVFGTTDKSDFLLAPFVLAIVYAALANTFGLPMWKPLIAPFWQSEIPGWVGLGFCLIAVIGIIIALISFGNSFRVGIDAQKPAQLVTTGLFSLSRNPIYVCFNTFFFGLFLVHGNIVILIAAAAFAMMIHRQILREEKFLKSHYGADYEDYCRKVRRYV